MLIVYDGNVKEARTFGQGDARAEGSMEREVPLTLTLSLTLTLTLTLGEPGGFVSSGSQTSSP